jgi:hypothetical protein
MRSRTLVICMVIEAVLTMPGTALAQVERVVGRDGISWVSGASGTMPWNASRPGRPSSI